VRRILLEGRFSPQVNTSVDEFQLPQFVDLPGHTSLSERLRAYADGLDYLRRFFGPKKKLRQHVWKAQLVAMVVSNTGAPRDREVSALIGAVLDAPKYSEKAHQAWRLSHAELIHAELIRAMKTLPSRNR
jgi:hypothetical protein